MSKELRAYFFPGHRSATTNVMALAKEDNAHLSWLFVLFYSSSKRSMAAAEAHFTNPCGENVRTKIFAISLTFLPAAGGVDTRTCLHDSILPKQKTAERPK